MALRLVQFLAIMLTVLALVPHLAALPNKIAMAQAVYFIAQQIYAGWALFGIALFGALAANLAHNRAAQAGPIIRLCARLIFAYCCQPRKAAVARDRLAQSLARQGAIRFYGPECRSYAGCIPRQLPQPLTTTSWRLASIPRLPIP